MRTRRSALTFFGVAWCLFFAGAWAGSAQAQTEKGQGCRDDIAAGDGYKIHSVKVAARYLPKLSQPLPSPGSDYSPVVVSELQGRVFAVLRQEALREDEEGETEHKLVKAVTVGKGQVEDGPRPGGAIGFKLVTPCVKVVEPAVCKSDVGTTQCVDVTIHAISLRVDTSNPFANLLNIPRSNRPSFLSNVPGPLLAFNPKFGLSYDRNFGAAAALEVSANLLDLGKNLKSLPLKARRTRLDLDAKAQRALDGSFYNTASRISLSRSASGAIDRFGIDASFVADHNARGDNEYFKNALNIGGQVELRTSLSPFETVLLDGHYRRSSNRFVSKTALPSESISENAFQATALLNGRLLGSGVSRLALWVDANSPGSNREHYQRVAAQWGFAKEFILVHNETIGIEAIVGAARSWGDVPQYARFYGGNSGRNFLYEPNDSPTVTSFPVGPILRSFGANQATAGDPLQQGATSYWNVNLSATFPIPKWSSPLVPDISIELPTRGPDGQIIMGADGPVMEDRPLRVILKNQGESSRKVLERIFKKEGLSAEDAKSKANRELKSINAILGFIADEANLYSIKPLFMLDAARLNVPGFTSNQTRLAVGGGLQFTIVIAKFEAGYMRTLRGLPGDGKGNVVLRLFFQNLF
ncbi:MAG: hypothetical protein QOE77_459 [Blastocatellia bacterium]|jgi:hypothetical protein|nr:hypothetical protein [Blastocatellia bacterium]